MNHALRERILRFAAIFAQRDWSRPHLRVLLYHTLPNHLAIKFNAQVEWALGKFMIVSLSEAHGVMSRNGPAKPMLSFTFDDADLSVYDSAFPVLSRLCCVACVYVVPQYVDRGYYLSRGEKRPVMSWGQLRQLADAGWEIGSHSFSHAPLPICCDERLKQEVSWAKSVIEDRLGTNVVHFAYPYGAHDSRTENFLRECEIYRTVATCLRGPMHRDDYDRFRIRRDQTHACLTPHQLQTRLEIADRLGWVWLLRRNRGVRRSGYRNSDRLGPIDHSVDLGVSGRK